MQSQSRHPAAGRVARRGYLVAQLVKRDLRERYIGSAAGLLWSVLHPLVLVALYTFVITFVFKVRAVEGGPRGYAAFVLCGLLPWIALQESIVQSAASLVKNAPLIKKIRFPAEVVPVGVVFSSLLHQLIGTVVFVVILHQSIRFGPGSLPGLLLLLALQVALALGLGWLVASLNVFVRDTQHVVQLSFSLLFWLTPLVYDRSMVPDRLRWLVDVNPLSHLVAGYRAVFLGTSGPLSQGWLVLASWAVVLLFFGYFTIQRLKGRFADYL
ncbi:MAG: ABC transporter permease [Acidobacteriota bacterium]